MYLTKEELRELDEAGKRGAALREAVERKILTEKQADEIISRPKIEEDKAVGAKLIPFPRKVNLKEAISLAEKAHDAFREKYDYWYETEKAFVFAVSDYEGYGGFLMPFMVMKENGEVRFDYSQAMMQNSLGKVINEGKLVLTANPKV